MPKIKQPARVRFAPSPTGFLHIGSARTALYDYLLAKQTGGAFILRIEDTDQKRYQDSAEEDFNNALEWMGIKPDEGPEQGGKFEPYRQSQRAQIYRDHAKQLINSGDAFYCFCTPEKLSQTRETQIKQNITPHYDGTCHGLVPEEITKRIANGESYVIRFKSPTEGTTSGVDLLRGEITVDNSTVDDIILVKSDGLAVYHLAAMVDDYLMGITHVVRGSEWLPTFPNHVLIYRALGWQEPIWVHLSVLLKPDGKLIVLVKPQFEADRQDVGKGGIIKDPAVHQKVIDRVVNGITAHEFSFEGITESPIRGGEGNKEFLAYFTRNRA